MAMRALTIGTAARAAGVGVETIRFYERQKLIERPPKPVGAGVRRYPSETIARIRFIREAQQLGFSLREIRELLALRADPAADCSKVREQALSKLHEVHDKVERLREIGSALQTLIAACPAQGGLQACSIIDALELRSRRTVELRKPPTNKQRRNGMEDTNVKTTTFKIEGMRCDGCAEIIKGLLDKEQGVQIADVSFEKGEARVLFDPKATGEDRLIATIQKPGFRVVGRK